METHYGLLYKKYKNKYLKLKTQIGGNRIYYLPCEITHFTHQLYLNNATATLLRRQNVGQLFEQQNKESNNVVSIVKDVEFCQDPAIILKGIMKRRDGTNFSAIKIKSASYLEDFNLLNQEDIPNINDNDLGGNFIASPDIGQNIYGNIFCFSGISQEVERLLRDNCMQPLNQLQCSFRFKGSRHIDECMCFMPYGAKKFKVWMYQIRNIIHSRSLTRLIPTNPDKTVFNAILTAKRERFLNVPVRPATRYNPNPINIPEILHKLTTDTQTAADRVHIIKIPHLIGLTPEETAIFNHFYNPQPYIVQVSDINAVRTRLIEEQLANRELVAQAIFKKPYSEVTDSFVFFPIDLELEAELELHSGLYRINYTIRNIPIFNRVWFENDNMVMCLFSRGSEIDPDVEAILAVELPQLKSRLASNQSKQVDIRFYNTSQSHSAQGAVGGNLHCLIKSVLL